MSAWFYAQAVCAITGFAFSLTVFVSILRDWRALARSSRNGALWTLVKSDALTELARIGIHLLILCPTGLAWWLQRPYPQGWRTWWMASLTVLAMLGSYVNWEMRRLLRRSYHL